MTLKIIQPCIFIIPLNRFFTHSSKNLKNTFKKILLKLEKKLNPKLN